MNPYLDNIKTFLARLSAGQKAALAGVLVGGAALLIGIAHWAGQPDYALLFGRLESTDANQIVEALQAQDIKYELRDSGTAIFVPRDQVYELRLQFAGEGVVSDGPTGYELFDQGTLGMTDFMQKLNLKRALEGELARTISSVRQVELSRVHLVIPERSPFRETQNTPSASVVLQLAGNNRLSTEQIEGITALVSGAVEGLAPDDVTVLDTRGNLLSNPDSGDPLALEGSTQLKMQRATETHLTEKGQSMLDQMLGPGNAIVRVAAELDFNRTIEERETIDPESATVVSEERLEEEGGNGLGAANSAVRNYELSRTRERSEKSIGEISYLTVSVILNYKRPAANGAAAAQDAAEGADVFPEPAPYADAELVEIQDILKNAVGFNDARGDQFAIHQTRFDTSVDERLAAEMREQRHDENLQLYLRYGLMVLALALAAWLLRSATRRITGEGEAENPVLTEGDDARAGTLGTGTGADGERGQLPAADDEEEEELVLIDDVYTSKLSPEAKKRLRAKHLMFEEIQAAVLQRPQEAAELIRSWLVADQNGA